MRKAGLFLVCMLLAGCFSRPLIKPLKPLEIPLAPYQGVVTAALAGSLMYEGDCLLFRDEETKNLLMPIWPVGSTFNGTAVLFHQPGKSDQHVMVAEEFVMEGQPLLWGRLQPGYYLPFQHQCPGYQAFFVSSVRPAD